MNKTTKKVCYILGGSKLSGAEKRIIITAIKLSKNKKNKVWLITSERLKKEFLSSELTTKDYKSIKWVTRKKSKIKSKYIRRAINLLRNSLLNIIQIPIFNAYIHVALYDNSTLLSLLGSRLIGTSKFYYEITSPDVAKSSATHNLKKYSFLSDKLICVSESVRRQLNYKDNSKIYVRKHPLAYRSQENGHRKKENIVVYAHRLVERKNPQLAAKAFQLLALEYPQWNFLICGVGPLESQVSHAVSLANLNNFSYLGYVYNMDSLMKKSKIFVSLIEPDNYPSQSVFNALANGNALIVSNTGVSKNKFIKKNGYAVELTLESVTHAIRNLISSNEVEDASKHSKKLFKSRYRQELYFMESEDIYD